ncbi:MAG: hypothetical protein AB8G23_08035 [Myxococcota bacterium]
MILAVIQAVLAISYPLIIWFGLARFEPRVLAIVVLAFAGLRLLLGRNSGGEATGSALRGLVVPALLIAGVVGAVVIWNDAIGLLLMPVAISLAFLLAFGFSLVKGPPMVERFARLQVESLSPEEELYCRRVTWIWCGFFVVNAAIAGGLAWARALDAWVLYTGLISYVLMGLLFATEYVYRHWRFRRYLGALTDPILMRFFPPPAPPGDVSVAGGDSLSPELLERVDGEETRRVRWGVPEGLVCWPGHFPEQALLPGVLQLSWVMAELADWQGVELKLRRIEKLKFKLPVLPGDVLRAEMSRRSTAPGSFVFRVDLYLRDEQSTTLQVVADETRGAIVSAEISGSQGDAAGAASAPAHASMSTPTPTPGPTSAPARSDWPEPSELLPHAGNMLWVDRVTAHEGEETFSRVRTQGLGLFCEADGSAGAWHALEWMAQTVAAHDGVRRHAAGESIRPGMLLGTKRLEVFGGDLQPGAEFDVRVRHVFGGDSGMVSYDCEVRESGGAGEVRAKARLACRVGTAGAPLVPSSAADGP